MPFSAPRSLEYIQRRKWLLPILMLGVFAGCKPEPQITHYTAPKPESIETPISRPVRPDRPPSQASATSSSAQDLKYEAPEGWVEKKSGPFALRSFEATEGQERVDVTISLAGGDLTQNMNRWRGQLGLAEASADEIAAALKPCEINDLPAKFIEMHQPDSAADRQSILGYVIPAGEQTWFIKLRGPTSLAEKQRDAFASFAQSLKW